MPSPLHVVLLTKNMHIAAGWSRLLHDLIYRPAILDRRLESSIQHFRGWPEAAAVRVVSSFGYLRNKSSYQSRRAKIRTYSRLGVIENSMNALISHHDNRHPTPQAIALYNDH